MFSRMISACYLLLVLILQTVSVTTVSTVNTATTSEPITTGLTIISTVTSATTLEPTTADGDQCSSNPCGDGGSCSDLTGTYNCTCWPGYVDYNNNNTCTELQSPYNVTVTNVTETSIQVRWTNPSSGSYSGFIVDCEGLHGAVHRNETTASNASVAICTGVTSGALYNVSVYTHYGSSLSNRSNSADAVTVPLNVEQLKASPRSATEVNVSWTYNSSSQCTYVNITSNGSSPATVVQCNQTSSLFTNLSSDSVHDFTVRTISNYISINSNNLSLVQHSSTNQTTTSWTFSEKVQNMSVNDSQPFSLNVVITPPPNHSNIFKYILLVQYLVNNSIIQVIELNCSGKVSHTSQMVNCTNWWNNVPNKTTEVNCADQQISYNITALGPYTDYGLDVRAVNPAGCSDIYSINQSTTGWFPDCLQHVRYNSSNSTINLSWSEPASTSGVIRNYTVVYNDTYNHTVNYVVMDGNETEVTLVNLWPYTNYTINIIPMNDIGAGQCSDESKGLLVQTTIGYPQVPFSVRCESDSSTSLRVSWNLTTYRPSAPQTYFNSTANDTNDATLYYTAHSIGINQTSMIVPGLNEFWNYSVHVLSYTVDNNSLYIVNAAEDCWNRTNESTPGPVTAVSVTSLSDKQKCYQAYVSWKQPVERDLNGVITGYNITWTLIENGFTNSTTTLTPNVTIEVEAGNKTYDITVTARTSVGLGNVTHMTLSSTGTCRAEAIDSSGGVGIFKNTSNKPQNIDSTKSFMAEFNSDTFTNNKNGEIVQRGIIVSEDNETLNQVPESFDLTLNHFRTWAQVTTDDSQTVDEYRATVNNWTPRGLTKGTALSEQIGQNECDKRLTEDYCNGFLPAGRKYRLRAIVCTSMGCYVSKFSSHKFITTNPASLGWIAGVVIPCILLIVAAVIIFVLWRRNKKLKKEKYTRRSDSRRSSGSFSEDGSSMYQHARPDPISIHQFAVEVEQKHHNSNLKFAEEFETLKHSSPSHASTTAEEQHNRINNRYTNILPFEHSRVKLQPVDGSTDYINASYMTDKNGVRDFIAAQGPMQATIDHFWRMIWEQNVSYIVMVTSLFDKNREKCAKYWPDPVGHTVKYGDIDVHLLSEKDVKSFYVIRTFDVTYCKERRRVIQFFCDNIPDYGVPEDIDAFLDFIQEVRNIAGPKLTPPIVVHCSAGVGRTGTFIAIERLLRYMKHTNTIDIFGLILQMREHRAYMVQTEIQYVCIHDCIKRAVERGWHRAQYAPAVDEPIYVNNVSATAAAAAADATYANLGYQPDNPQPVSAADIELITFGVPKVIDH